MGAIDRRQAEKRCKCEGRVEVDGSEKTDGTFQRQVRLYAVVCAGAAGALAVFVLLTWLTGNWRLGTLGPDYVAMAPSTACLMMLLSITAIVRRLSRSRDGGRFMVILTVSAIAVTVLLSGARQYLGAYYPSTEAWLDAIMTGTVGVSFGSLSPLTVTVLSMTGVVLLFDLVPQSSRLLFRHLGPLLAVVGFLTALMVILGYAVGTPVPYGKHTTPMALPTAICLALLNAAISLEAHASMWAFPSSGTEPVGSFSGRRRYRWAFSALFALFTITLGVAGGLYLRQQQAAMHHMAKNKLEAIADVVIGQIVNWQTERMDDAKTFAAAPVVARALGKYLTGPDTESARTDVLNGLRVLNVASRYRQITVYDPGMTPRVGTSPDLPVPNAYLRGMFSMAVRERRAVMTDLCFGANQDAHIDFLAPVFAMNGDPPVDSSELLAVVIFRVDAGRFVSLLERILPTADPTMEVVLVGRQDKDMLFLSHENAKVQTLWTRAIEPSDVPGTMAVSGDSGIAEGPDYRDVPVVAAVRAIPGTPWAIVAKMDEAAIYAPSRLQAIQAASILLLLILATGLIVGILWRQRNIAWYREALALEQERSTLAQRFEHLMQHANDIILLAAADETIRDANDRAVESYGYSESALRRMKLSDLCAPPARLENARRNDEIKAAGSALYESVHMRADGSAFGVEVSANIVDIGGESCLLVMVRDISERELAAEALRASEQNLRMLFDSIQDFLFVVDMGGNILRVNEAVVTRLGYAKEELAGQSLLLLHPKEWREEAARVLESMTSGKTNICSIPLLAGDGSIIPVETHIVTGSWSGQKVLFGVSRDISALRASEEKFVKAFRNNPALMAITTIAEGRYQEVNESFLDTLGYEREEVVGKTSLELHLFADPGQRVTMKERVLEDGALRNYEVAVRGKDGQIRIGLFSAELIRVQDEQVLLTVMNDVTDQKHAEEELKKRTEEIERFFGVTLDLLCVAEISGRLIRLNAAWERTLGYPVSALENANFMDFIHPDDLPATRDTLARLASGEEAIDFVNRYRCRDGTYRWLDWRAATHQQTLVYAAARDITTKIQVQNELRETSRFNRQVIECAQEGIIVYGTDLRRQTWNPFMEHLTGISSAEALGKHPGENLPLSLDPRIVEMLKAALRGESSGEISFPFEAPLARRSGWATQSATPLRDEEGNITGIISLVRDITEQVRIEAVLEEEAEQYAAILRTTQDGFCLIDDSGRILDANENYCRITGYSRKELLGMAVSEIDANAGGEAGRKFSDNIKRSGSERFETQFRTKDGRLVDTEISINFMASKGWFIAFVRDITQRKHIEEALVRVNKAMESSRDAIAIGDPNGVHIYQNQAFTKLFGYTVEELVPPAGPAVAYSDPQIAREVFETILRGDSWTGELDMIAKDGRRFPVVLRADAIKDEQGNIIGVIGVHTDITQRRQREEERQAFLDQTQRDARTKAELLAEVNHRVKNNLTAILGLLLGEKQFAPAEGRAQVAAALDSLAQRIRGLLQVHQMLSDARWSPMRLNDLAERVIRAALVAVPKGHEVSMTLEPSQVQISPRQAGSLALVLNELAVNTAKHAFADRGKASIIVAATQADGMIQLEYRDNGPGYPQDVLDGGGGSVGMNLIRQLVSETLRGTLSIFNEGGAVAVLCIKTEDMRQT